MTRAAIDSDMSEEEIAGQEGRRKNVAALATPTSEADERYSVPLDAFFVAPDGTDVEFLVDDGLTLIGNHLIGKHASFSHLASARVAFLWKRKGGNRGGRLRFGQCQKPSGLLAYFSQFDFVVWLAADHCNATVFTRLQVEALVFHELKHAGFKESEDGERTWTVEGHDWEGFAEEIRLYGDWMPNISNIREAFQMHLFERK